MSKRTQNLTANCMSAVLSITSFFKEHAMTIKHICIAFAALTIGLLIATTTADAATVTVSVSAPTLDGADIYNLTGGANQPDDLEHIWSNRPRQGQSFTTGSNALGYSLSSVTLRSTSNSAGSANWNVRVGSIDGSDIPTWSIADVIIDGTGVNMTSNTYVTWTFDSPLTLLPNTLYGFDVFPDNQGFISDNAADDTAYAGGSALSSGDNLPAAPPNALTVNNFDRVFHVDLAEVVVPEPSAFALAALSITGLCTTRRRLRR
ncbi:MAG: hypothetical protein MI757_09030 [Pirellulales bacterium]|nr:hypothetical protein [Pirellulales bacterium]